MPTRLKGAVSTLPLLLLFFVSGATTLVYEISWTRQAGLLFGHTVLAGSVVLASLFLGLAIGYCVGGWLSSLGNALRWFGVCEIAAAAWAICVPTLLVALQSQAIAQWMSSESMTWQFASRASIGVLLLLPATVALGATLPLMSQALARVSDHPTRSAAIGYALNTTGAMAGTLVCTYLLLVQVGVARSSYVAAGVGVLVGVIAIALSRSQVAEVVEDSDSDNPAETLARSATGRTKSLAEGEHTLRSQSRQSAALLPWRLRFSTRVCSRWCFITAPIHSAMWLPYFCWRWPWGQPWLPC